MLSVLIEQEVVMHCAGTNLAVTSLLYRSYVFVC